MASISSMNQSLWVIAGLLILVSIAGCVELPSKKAADSSNILEGTIVTDHVQKGNYVTLYYKGTLDDNSVFDQTSEGNPAVFQVGVGGLIPGFDNGLIGMKVGEKKTIVAPPAQAYGEFNASAVLEVPQQQLIDANIPVVQGITVQSSQGNGKIIALDVVKKTATIDFNHPLAGKTLTFEVEILKIDNKP